MASISSCHWKTLVHFCFKKKRHKNTFLTLIVNYHKLVQKKTNYAIQNNNKLAIYVIYSFKKLLEGFVLITLKVLISQMVKQSHHVERGCVFWPGNFRNTCVSNNT